MRDLCILTPISLVAFLALLLLMPLVFGQLMFAALAKLHLSPDAATVLMILIIFGGFINIPVARYRRDDVMPSHPLAILGMNRALPQWQRPRRETIIAVNLGGCVVPTGLAAYELLRLGFAAPGALAAVIACAINIFACYRLARPVEGIGIVMPSLVSPVVAALVALILAPAQAAPIAFIAGVAGPLIGADLLHLREIRNTTVGVASIGGAGTFDGIILSGIIAAYLA